jgi:transposase
MMESLYGPVAGLDVHKKTVVVVLLQSVQPDQDYASGIFGATQFGPKELVTFLRQHGVTHAAMDPRLSIGGRCGWHWKGEFTLTLAQARSTRARRGRKWDKADARRIVKRLLSGRIRQGA